MMCDGLGTYDPRPEGTAWSLGHRECPEMLHRLLTQCYRDMLPVGQAEAFHTAKRLHEQLTGSIDQIAVSRMMLVRYASVVPFNRIICDQDREDAERFGMVDWEGVTPNPAVLPRI